MPSLLEVQRGVRDALLGGAGVPAWIVGGERAAAQRLDVYRNTVTATLVRALRLAFPTVERLVGAEFFNVAAQVFALGHPPAKADLNDYGAAFASFLQDYPSCAGLPYLPDIARLDRAVTRALHADDAAPMDLQALAGVAPAYASTLHFEFHPAVSLLQSDFPVDAIWAAVLQQDDTAMAAIDLHDGPACLLIERVAGKPVVHRMPPAHWAWTAALAQGHALGDLIADAAADEVAAVLAQHLLAGRLIAFQADAFEEIVE